ncbi:MAG: hypothetical protein V1845_01890 [bacterium]
MSRKNTLVLISVLLVILILAAWSPWITKSYAENKTVKTFEDGQKGIVDGCGFNCTGCGVISSNKIIFGYSVVIEYGCGFRMPEDEDLNGETTIFVSFIGTVHNLKK